MDVYFWPKYWTLWFWHWRTSGGPCCFLSWTFYPNTITSSAARFGGIPQIWCILMADCGENLRLVEFYFWWKIWGILQNLAKIKKSYLFLYNWKNTRKLQWTPITSINKHLRIPVFRLTLAVKELIQVQFSAKLSLNMCRKTS